MTATKGTLSTQCQYQGHANCPTHVTRARDGITSGINYIHHPQPLHGESLLYETIRCICQCHQTTRPAPPQIMP